VGEMALFVRGSYKHGHFFCQNTVNLMHKQYYSHFSESCTIFSKHDFLSSSTFYDREAILMDAVDGPILASLLGINGPLLIASIARMWPDRSDKIRNSTLNGTLQ
jgi:hypothetical protein